MTDSVLEPGERVLYEAQFHKKYKLFADLCLALVYFLLVGIGVYLYIMVVANKQSGEFISMIIVYFITWYMLSGSRILIETIVNYFSEGCIVTDECIVTDKRIIKTRYFRRTLGFGCLQFQYEYMPLPPLKIVVGQCRLEKYFDVGTITFHGDLYTTDWFPKHKMKDVEAKHEDYVWTRAKYAPSYSCGCAYIRAPFALKQFLESRAPQA